VIRVAVVGATGYVGSEVVRVLLGHPFVEVAAVVARNRAGVRYDAAVPALLGCTDLTLSDLDPAALAAFDVVMLCLPHGVARTLVPDLEAAGVHRIIDLSNDHRLSPDWVYGSPEWSAEKIFGASRVAVPGCFATAIQLAYAPLVRAGAIRGKSVQVCAATGSTGSGVSPARGTHHPERAVNLKAYKVLQHQHVPEVTAMWSRLGVAPRLDFVPLSLPVDRGIFATCFAEVDPELDLGALFREAYGDKPAIRLRDDSPELRHVRGTGFCDLAVHREGDCAVVLAAIDNLGKGAATQAVQCLNLCLGLPATAGWRGLPCTP
jgi:N-acetyl-gamma-glutamyl-phosphate/LysW-gamma-L-alpha-aminoadipyl-6-phosphate reductase